jgi:hypothetical protein
VGLYITPQQVADIIGWTQEAKENGEPEANAVRRARDWLISSGAAIKRGGKWVTTKEKLKMAFPEVYEEIQISKFMEDE